MAIKKVRYTVTELLLRPAPATPPDLEGADPATVVGWALAAHERGRIAIVTALQKEGMVVVDLAIRLDPGVRVVTIDTGRLPAETHAFIDVVRNHYGRDLEVIRPDPSRVTEFVVANGPDAFLVDPGLRAACCAVRKVEPNRALLAGLDCWLVGLRRAQSTLRASTPVVDASASPLKVSPLAAMTAAWVDAYTTDHSVPVHPLYAQGYRSIGCAPCTRAVRPGEDARAGRWWWENGVDSECGIHRRPEVRPERGAT